MLLPAIISALAMPANMGHGLVMAVQALTDVSRYWSKFLIDVPWILGIALVIFLQARQTNVHEWATAVRFSNARRCRFGGVIRVAVSSVGEREHANVSEVY